MVFLEWIKECESDPEVHVELVEGKDQTGMYLTRSKHKGRGTWRILLKPIYHVWIGGKDITHTPDKQLAYREWHKRPRNG